MPDKRLIVPGAVVLFGVLILAILQPEQQIPFSTLQRAAETRVNTFTASTQDHSCLATWPDGSSVVVWDSRRQQSGTYGIYLQRFDVEGQRIGGEIRVNLFQDGMQMNPAVAVDGTGATWVAWESYGQDGSMNGIIARRFDPQEFSGSDEILVNQVTEGQQAQVVVSGDSWGNATFAWTTPATSGHSQRVVYRTFDSSGIPRHNEVAVHETGHHQHLPSIATGEDRTLIVWAETNQENRPAGIFAKRIDSSQAADTARTNAIRVNDVDQATHIEPVVTSTSTGFVAGWLRSTESDYEVVFRQLDHSGNSMGPSVVASPTDGKRVNGVALADSKRGLFVGWNRSIDGAVGRKTIVEARRFSSDGLPTGPAFQINEDPEATHGMTAACGKSRMNADQSGRLFVAWNGHCDDDSSAVGLTVWTPQADSRFALQAALEMPMESGQETAKPHEPPIFNRKHVPRGRFGGDRNPFSRSSAFGFIGITNTGWRPPDPTIAVGPNHVIATTNGEIAFFEKDGTMTFQDEIEDSFGFWGNEGATGLVFDPEVLWDPHTNRFFAMANERASGESFFLLAVSDDDDPNGSWNKYRFNVTAISDTDIDSPNMAIDTEAIYLTADFFGPDKYLVYMLDKADVLAGIPNPAATDILITGTQSYGIAMNYDAGAPATYMIRGDEFVTSTTLHLSAITDPLGTPSIVTTDITVPTYGHPVDPVSMGTSIRPELFESRFWSCVYRNGSLWAVHHQSPDSSTDVARVRWYEIDMQGWPLSGNTPTLVQSGDISPDPNTYTFFPSIWVDDGGNAAITFAKSSATEFISMCRSLRMAGEPLGEFQPLEVVRPSDAGYTLTRWGDYSGTMDDPADSGVFWGIHEYAPTATSWNTWIGKYELPFIEVPAEGAKFLDGLISGGQISDADGSNDQYLHLDPSPTSNLLKQKIDLILQATSPTATPINFGFRLESRMIGGPSGDVVHTVSFWDYNTNTWEIVDTRPAEIVDDRILISPGGDLTRFIHPIHGEITAKLTWVSDSFSGAGFVWSIDVDQAIWEITD